MTPLEHIDQVRPYFRPSCYAAVSGGNCVFRLSLGKVIIVNFLQVVIVNK